MNMIDLTDQRFERLVVIKLGRKGKQRGDWYWWCRCDCGVVKEVLNRSLRHGHARSCGCLHRDNITKDLCGLYFGRLRVVSRLDRQAQNGAFYWLCQCECGGTTQVSTGNLRAGLVKSCGCLAKETARKLLLKHGLYSNQLYRNAYHRVRKEKKRHADKGWSPFLSWLLFNFYPACAVCGLSQTDHLLKYKESLHVDHVKPLSKGYGLCPGNAVLLCKLHNVSKFTKSLDELPIQWQENIVRISESFRLAVLGGF